MLLGVPTEDGDNDCVAEDERDAVPLAVCVWLFEQLGVAETGDDSD